VSRLHCSLIACFKIAKRRQVKVPSREHLSWVTLACSPAESSAQLRHRGRSRFTNESGTFYGCFEKFKNAITICDTPHSSRSREPRRAKTLAREKDRGIVFAGAFCRRRLGREQTNIYDFKTLRESRSRLLLMTKSQSRKLIARLNTLEIYTSKCIIKCSLQITDC